jgi:hypothetical protein
MKKKTTAQPNLKLKLNRETLLQLKDAEVTQALGASLDPCRSGNPPCPFT